MSLLNPLRAPKDEMASWKNEISDWEESGEEDDCVDGSDESSSDEELDQRRKPETKKLITSIFDHLHAISEWQFLFASTSAATSSTNFPPRPSHLHQIAKDPLSSYMKDLK